jgi:hypothetical protein
LITLRLFSRQLDHTPGPDGTARTTTGEPEIPASVKNRAGIIPFRVSFRFPGAVRANAFLALSLPDGIGYEDAVKFSSRSVASEKALWQ